MELGALQKKKLLHLFDLYDRERDGFLVRTDYELVAHAIATELGHAPDTAEHEEITRAFYTQFARMREIADFSRDGRIAPDEWLDFFEIVLEDPRAFDAVVTSTLDLVFSIFDLDDNTVLDRAELARLRRGFGLPVEGTDDVFDALDLDGDGTLSAAEVRLAIEQFLKSEDERAPGNAFFGPLGV